MKKKEFDMYILNMPVFKGTLSLTATTFTANAFIAAPDPTFITTLLGLGLLGLAGTWVANTK